MLSINIMKVTAAFLLDWEKSITSSLLGRMEQKECLYEFT